MGRDMIRKLLKTMTVAFVLTGCHAVGVKNPVPTGYLAVDFICDSDDLTRAEDIDLSDFDVAISGPVELVSKCAALPEIIELQPGHYTISVQSPGQQPAAFEQPIFGAMTDFEIKDGATTSVKLICTMLNMKVTVNPSPAFLSQVKTYEVKVSNGQGELIWTPEDVSQGRAGYFAVAPLDITLTGLSLGDAPLSYDGLISDVEASDHHVISFDSF